MRVEVLNGSGQMGSRGKTLDNSLELFLTETLLKQLLKLFAYDMNVIPISGVALRKPRWVIPVLRHDSDRLYSGDVLPAERVTNPVIKHHAIGAYESAYETSAKYLT